MEAVGDDGRGGGGAMVGGADVGGGGWLLRSAIWMSWFLDEAWTAVCTFSLSLARRSTTTAGS